MKDEKWRTKKQNLLFLEIPKKKNFKDFSSSKTQGKKTVLIEKQSGRSSNKGNFNKPFPSNSPSNYKKGTSKPNFPPKTLTAPSDFERRKLAEQRATKKIKSDTDKDKKTKLGTKKRQVKLTVSRALSDEIETRERSLASVKRARQKELKNVNKDENKENLKPIKEM